MSFPNVAWRSASAFAVCLFVVGCGGAPEVLSASPSEALSLDAGVENAAELDPSHSAVEPSPPSQMSPELVLYAGWRQSRVQAKNPSPLGAEWAVSRTTALSLVRVEWHGDSGESVETPCALHNNVVHGGQVIYPPSFLEALGVARAPLQRAGSAVEQRPTRTWLGLRSGYAEAMPKLGEAKHPALKDADGDGQPGVTVEVRIPILGAQRLYIAQRTVSGWKGEESAGKLRALPQTTFEQSTVGASLPFLVRASETKPVEGMAPEELLWVRLPEAMNCAQLLNKATSLFGQPWPPP